MGAYTYKDVVHRADFDAAIKPAMESCGCTVEEYDSDSNYNGDNWRVAAYLLGQKDAEIERLRDENGLLTAAIHFAHEQGFEWPADPFAFLSNPPKND